MKKKWPILLVFVFLFSSICILSIIQKNRIQNKYAKKNGPYFQTMQITRLTEARIPCINIEIEGEMIETEVDTGSDTAICLSKEILDKIKGKKFRGVTKHIGVRNKIYQSNSFELSEVKLGKATVSRLEANEINLQFEKDSRIQTTVEASTRKLARAGWELFSRLNLYLDCENYTAAICDSIETLQKKGFMIECIETPLIFIGNRLIGFEAETNTGTLLCALDTGFTGNFLINSEAEQSIEEAFQNPENHITVPFLKIGSQDFGTTRFIHAPVRLPLKFDAFLGMEFIYYNQIFIDFGKGKIYFSIPKEEDDDDDSEKLALGS